MFVQNVVKLNNATIYDQIEKYLTKHEYNSTGTAQSYRRDIELFFKVMKNKEIQYLTREDIQLTIDDFEDFIKMLYDARDGDERQFANKTINRKVSAIKGVIKYLAGKKLVDDVSFLELIDTLPETENPYGVLEVHEVLQLAELARKERNKGDIKRLLILFSLDTCVRKSALLNLKWSNFVEMEDGVSVQGVDKGNKDFRHKISKDFYNELLSIKKENSELVFDISGRRVNDMMERLLEVMALNKDRKLVFHSIRKAGVTFRYRVTGDILEAQRAAGHSRIDTTRLYLQAEDYGVMGAVSTGGNIDTELYKTVDHELLVEAISQCKKDFQLFLNIKLKEIMNGK